MYRTTEITLQAVSLKSSDIVYESVVFKFDYTELKLQSNASSNLKANIFPQNGTGFYLVEAFLIYEIKNQQCANTSHILWSKKSY